MSNEKTDGMEKILTIHNIEKSDYKFSFWVGQI